ncbi:MAG: enoyl-CoA hydratase-related protein [bacterium]
MAYTFKGLNFEKIGVIGSGQIGPDIALHFTKVFHQHGVPVVVVDVADTALEAGQTKLYKKIDRGVKSGAFSPEMAEAMKKNVTFTSDYDALQGTSFVVEAATEDQDLKGRIFTQIRKLCPDALLASNSSHLEPEVIFAPLADKSKTLVIHYFFPAERNVALEIIPGAESDGAVIDDLLGLYESIGKVPIKVGSRYGYAVDPIFEGIFQAAALCVEEGMGTTKEVDAAAARALGLTVGPFTAMNLTGGNPITFHGLDMSHDRLNKWFKSPKILADAMKTGEKWDTPARGETVDLPAEQEQKIADAMRGAFFGLSGQIIDSGITNVADLEMELELALDLIPAFRHMNKVGLDKSLALVEAYAATHPDFPVPECIKRQAAAGEPWQIDFVTRRDVDDVAVVTIRRPKVLNALNSDVFAQLRRHFEAIRDDAKIKAAVLTGFGTKAFVSGADVTFIANMDTPEAGIRDSQASQSVGDFIESLEKPVICAYNGLAFGGGNEVGMCCTARICRAGLKVAVGQPEVNLGIIPGAGGTQRLPRLIGIKKAAELLRTGRPISGAQAVQYGLMLEEVEPTKLLDRAVELARQVAVGEVEVKRLDPSPVSVPDALPDLELGHLSKAIDAILCRAILEGCAMELSAGLKHESNMFGECCKTEDMTIGVKNFLEKGPRSKAPFVHR